MNEKLSEELNHFNNTQNENEFNDYNLI